MEANKKFFWNIFWIAAGCILLYWLIGERARFLLIVEKFENITAPFIFGSVLAFILNVPMRFYENLLVKISGKRLRRTVAVLLTFVSLLIVLAVVFLLLIPQLSETLDRLIPRLISFATAIGREIESFLQSNPDLMEWLNENTSFESLDIAGLVQKAISVLGNSFGSILGGAMSALGKLTSFVMDFVIGLVFAVYCLFQKETLARQGRKLLYAFVPEKAADYVIRIMRLTNSTFSNFLAGQCIEVVILGTMFAVAMAIFGMPYIPLVSVLIAVTAFIPVVGAWVGCIFGAFLIFVANPVQALWFVVMFVILQQLENNLIYPKVVGTSIGLSGMWVLLAVGIGGQLMGVAGMFLMIPVFSVFYTLLQEQTHHRLHLRDVNSEKLTVQPPEISSKIKNKLKSKTSKKDNKDKA